MKTKGRALYPFVPSGPSFAAALEFFAAIDFKVQWQHEGLAGLRFGEAYFILQEIDVPEWQKNQMIKIEVDDLEGYWSEIEGQKLAERFPGVRVRPPTDFAWGREIHIVDPAGVCWHVRGATSPA